MFSSVGACCHPEQRRRRGTSQLLKRYRIIDDVPF